MKEQFVLVDFENVQKVDLAQLPAHARIQIFVGAPQAKLPTLIPHSGGRVMLLTKSVDR